MSENLEQEVVGMEVEESAEARETRKRLEEKKVIDRVIRGVNDTFEKDYNIPELGIKMKIKAKAPNAMQIGKIQARLSMYLGGMNNYAPEYILIAYQMLATLRETGIDVPKELEKDEDIFNLDILYHIGVDFKRWLDTFRL